MAYNFPQKVLIPMLDKPEACSGCVLKDIGIGFVKPEFSEAYHDSGLMILGEKPDFKEIEEGLPMRASAPSGAVLERAIRRAKLESFPLQRGMMTISNILNCMLPNGQELSGSPYEYPAIEHCKTHWESLILKVKPRVILACGAPTVRTLTGLGGSKELSLSYLRGYPIWSETYSCWIVGTYNPGNVKKNPKLGWVFLQDLEKAAKIAKNGYEYPVERFNLKPTLDDIRAFKIDVENNPNLALSVDIENTNWKTNPNNIESVQFSLRKDEAIFIDVDEWTTPLIANIMALPNDKVGHNIWRYDDPNLTRFGIPVNGTVHDTMFAFRAWQPDLLTESVGKSKTKEMEDIPSLSSRAGLQYVASLFNYPFFWKHLRKISERLYGCRDTSSVLYIWNDLEPLLNAMKYEPLRLGV